MKKRQSYYSIKFKAKTSDDLLRQLAFDNSLQANILSEVSSGKIILANRAACKLLNYSKKELLTKHRSALFHIKEGSFKKMLEQRAAAGRSGALLTAIKKSGKRFPCEITSAIFIDEHGIEKSITTVVDISQNIQRQKNIDLRKDKIVANNIVLAKSKQKKIDASKEKIVAVNIIDAEKNARDVERSDIANELHDNINQLLAASKLYIEMVKKDGENTEMYLNRSSEYILTAIDEIRKLTQRLKTNISKKFGLSHAIHNIMLDTMEVTPVEIFCTLNFIEHRLNNEFKLNVFRIVQEQINNILKHSKATKTTISLIQNKKSIILSISNNGDGFETTKKRNGIGINNIKSRATSYYAIPDFTSQPGKGCVLSITFPITEAIFN